MSDLKGSKNESKTKNFNMGFQKKKATMRAVYFLPNMWHISFSSITE